MRLLFGSEQTYDPDSIVILVLRLGSLCLFDTLALSIGQKADMSKKHRQYWDVAESIDYAPFNNRIALRRQEMLCHTSQGSSVKTGRTFYMLVATVVTGLLIGITGRALEMCITFGIRGRNAILMILFRQYSQIVAAFTLVGVNLCLLVCSAALVQWMAPGAAGSGVSLVMALLNGNNISGLLTPMVYLVKFFGTVCTRVACLPLGPEGPLIHLGACIASMVFRAGHRIVGWSRMKNRERVLEQTRDAVFSNASLRQLISAGAAAGMAAAFGAPIGGVLFALEEACSVWSKKTAWRCLLAGAVSVFAMSQILPGTGEGYIISFAGIYPLSDRQWLFQMPFVVMVSVTLGFLGALFNLMRGMVQHYRVSKKKHGLRVVEACAVGFVSSITFLLAPKLFGQCLDIPTTWEASQVMQYDCPVGQYNDLATALFQTAPLTIRSFLGLGSESEPIANRICSPSIPCYYTLTSLFAVGMIYFALLVISAGLAVPGGLFMPTIMIGGSLGAFFGLALHSLVSATWDIQPGVYAIVGAAAMLAAVFRSSVSLVVILVEGTRGISFLPGVLMAVIISNFMAHWIHPEGVYETELEVDGRVFFLREDPGGRLRNKTAEALMAFPVVGLQTIVPVSQVLHVLSSTTHNGFPVYRDSNTSTPCLVGFILRSQLLILLAERAYCDSYGSYIHSRMGSITEYEDKLNMMMHHAVYGGNEIAEIGSDSEDETSESTSDDSPERSSSALQTHLNLEPFMDCGMITVRPETPAAYCHHMFVTMSLRHVCVTKSSGDVVGIITRKDLDRAAGEGWWRRTKMFDRNDDDDKSGVPVSIPRARRAILNLIQSFSPSANSGARALQRHLLDHSNDEEDYC